MCFDRFVSALSAANYQGSQAKQGRGFECRDCDALIYLQQSMRRGGGSVSEESEDESESVSEQPYSISVDGDPSDRADLKENEYCRHSLKRPKCNSYLGRNYSGSGQSKEKPSRRKDPDFIKMNSRPMMEMKGGSNVWFQARIVKERATEVLVTFPGVTDDEDDTKEWVSKLSGRIWYGEYRTKAWKYLGKGSWRPKASTKMKIPPLVAKMLKERENMAGDSIGGAEIVTADTQRQHVQNPKMSTGVSEAHEDDHLHIGCAVEVADHTTGGDGGAGDCWCERMYMSQNASAQRDDSAQGSRQMCSGESALAKWFDAHFRNLKSADLFDDHPAQYSLETDKRTLSHVSASTSKEASPDNTLHLHKQHERHAKISVDGVGHRWMSSVKHPQLGSDQGKHAENVEHFSPGCSISDSEDDTKLIGKRRRTPSKHVLESDVDCDSEEIPRKSPPVRRDRLNKSKGIGKKVGSVNGKRSSRQRRSKEWKPPKELCDLLDGMFEGVQPRGGRQHPSSRGGSARGTLQHSSASASKDDLDDKCVEETILDARQEPGASKLRSRSDAADIAQQRNGDVANMRNAGNIFSREKKTRRPAGKVPRHVSTPRGRVLLSDSEESESDSDAKQELTESHSTVATARPPCSAHIKPSLPHSSIFKNRPCSMVTDMEFYDSVPMLKQGDVIANGVRGTDSTDFGSHPVRPRSGSLEFAADKQEAKSPSKATRRDDVAELFSSGHDTVEGRKSCIGKSHANMGQAVRKKHLVPPNKDAAFRVAADRGH